MLGSSIRPCLRNFPPRIVQRQLLLRRHLSSKTPSQRPRTWKGSAARWGLAAVVIWYYNVNDTWEDYGFSNLHMLETQDDSSDADFPTLESLVASRRERLPTVPAFDAPSSSKSNPQDPNFTPITPSPTQQSSSSMPSTSTTATPPQDTPALDLEEEAESEGAFNPETGEINWDCPCLGGMAHGPCGQEFRDAFSCFVYSEKEPKGIECIDRFKVMQDCFRAHPDVYGSELTGEDDDESLDGEIGGVEEPVGSGVPANVAPYSGEETPADRVPGANLTSVPSASPGSVSDTTGISAQALSVDDNAQRTRKSAETTPAQRSKELAPGNEAERRVPKTSPDTKEKSEGS